MAKVSFMCLHREMVEGFTTPVPLMAMWLAFTPLPLARLTRTAVKPTMTNSVQAKWPSRSATTAGRSREHMILGIPTIKW